MRELALPQLDKAYLPEHQYSRWQEGTEYFAADLSSTALGPPGTEYTSGRFRVPVGLSKLETQRNGASDDS